MRYLCVKTCYFDNRLYEKGVSADFPVGTKVPEHFICIEPEQVEEKSVKTEDKKIKKVKAAG